MYVYQNRKINKNKVVAVMILTIALVSITIALSLRLLNPEEVTPVVKNEDVPVLQLPDSNEKVAKPFNVDATVALDYFDGEEGEVESVSEFEGVFRPNQGMDYVFNNEEFDVVAMLSGTVVNVKEDPMFGHSVSIQTGPLIITYQSLKDMKLSEGESVNQGDVLSLASSNIFSKDLGNHLHIVVSNNGTLVDPESVYDKTLSEIK